MVDVHFLTPSECDAWIASAPACGTSNALCVELPPESGRLLFVARSVVDAIMFRERCLLRVTECEVANNNWHLYYRLRQSYGDHSLIDDAPGHLFLDYEAEDLITFLHLAMLFGWDADIRPIAPYLSGKLSHDGFLDLYSAPDGPDQLVDLAKLLESARFTTRRHA